MFSIMQQFDFWQMKVGTLHIRGHVVRWGIIFQKYYMVRHTHNLFGVSDQICNSG